ncbi:MAG: WecB/TagA/CpsF family glycosyltransferase [Fimbriimonadaceae bacterium]|nr:WecB/TagA/CpsF family glycosyltransferase [Fimbriimonadaceae bacterium]
MTSLTSSGTTERDRVEVLGLPVDRVTMSQALETIEGFIAEGSPHLVVTADSSGIVQAQTDPEWFGIFAEADLVTPDSIGVVWAAKRAGKPVKDRVSGVDMVDQICKLSALKGYRIVFLGAAPGVAEMAAEALRLRHPGCNIVHARHGYFPADSDEVVAEEIAEHKPDVLFVAMGIPRQEKFIRHTQEIIKAPVAMGVGGSFDVFSGKTKRAPKIIQKLKLEWLWRTLLNPSKIKKAKALPKFAWLVIRSKR